MNYQGYSNDNIHIGDVIITGVLDTEEEIEVKTLAVSGNTEIKGDLTVSGEIISRDELIISDSLFEINAEAGLLNNTFSSGYFFPYNDGSVKYSGLIRTPSSGIFSLVNNETKKPTSTTASFSNIGSLDTDINSEGRTFRHTFDGAANSYILQSTGAVPYIQAGSSQISLLQDTVCTGQIRGIQGTAAEPAYSYPSGVSTGMYFGSAGLSIGFSLTNDDFLFLKKTSEVIETLKNIVPSINNTFDIGSASVRYRNVYAEEQLNSNDRVNGFLYRSKDMGLVSAPNFSFAAATNTGMWMSAANNLSFAVDGVNQLDIKTNRAKFTKPVYSSTGIYPYGLPVKACMMQQLITTTVADSVTDWRAIHQTSGFVSNNGTITIPANYVKAAMNINILITGNITNISSPSIGFRILLGSTVLASIPAYTLSNVSNEFFRISGSLVFRNDAIASTVVASCLEFTYNTTVAAKSGKGASSGDNVDMTVANDLQVQIAYSATGSSSAMSSLCAEFELIDY